MLTRITLPRNESPQAGVSTYVVGVAVAGGHHHQPVPALLPRLWSGISTPGSIFVGTGELSFSVHPRFTNIFEPAEGTLTLRKNEKRKKNVWLVEINANMPKVLSLQCWFLLRTDLPGKESFGRSVAAFSRTDPVFESKVCSLSGSSPPPRCRASPDAASPFSGCLAEDQQRFRDGLVQG